MDKRKINEEKVMKIMKDKNNLIRLLRKIRADRDFAIGFKKILNKTTFREKTLNSLFFYINIYIEKIHMPCFDDANKVFAKQMQFLENISREVI